MIDLSKLTSAPWTSVRQHVVFGEAKFVLARGMEVVAIFEKEDDCDAAALARNALDIWMRHPGWVVEACAWDGSNKRWCVRDSRNNGLRVAPLESAFPYLALVETAEWLKQHVEGEQP